MAPRERTTQIMKHQEDKLSKMQSNQTALPHQDDCNTRMDIKKRTTNIEQLQTPTIGVTINNKSTTIEPLQKSPGGLNAFYWYQIFAKDSAVVEVQEMFS